MQNYKAISLAFSAVLLVVATAAADKGNAGASCVKSGISSLATNRSKCPDENIIDKTVGGISRVSSAVWRATAR